MMRPLEGDCELKDTFWHSSAHILGRALERQYGCKLCTGPCASRGHEGFYYDAFYGDLGLNEDDLKSVERAVKKAIKEKQPFERIEVTREQALVMFSENKFKAITVYRCGPLVDLCSGPHIPNTSFVEAFSCLKASSAYWKGNKERESMQRVYGISFPDRRRLDEYLTKLEEAKKYDHRILGAKQELFSFHRLSPGSPFIKPHGTRIYNKLEDFMRVQYRERGYKEVITPNAYDMHLWKTSGHAEKYKENMFVFEIDKHEFGFKPMNCLLPLRLAEFGVLHRNEASGALSGLTRVRRFVQDDAHIFCRESQIKAEVKNVLEFIRYVYNIFGFSFELELSTKPEKYLGEIEDWDKAEGDGAFYGPKIDISVSDALKRKFQCATLQLDFQLPTQFGLSYSAEGEANREKPVLIHRAVLGSIERMLAILLEHYKGKWPFWLIQTICPAIARSDSKDGYYVDVDISDRKISKKIRQAQLAQYNYMLVVGEAEVNTNTVSIRNRDDSHEAKPTVMSAEELLKFFKEETAAFR
ncbi:hypothetical protein MKW92_040424 [Papaver armeniacum]|nr:hypothetical protein MKW92_040424 [Papaver armeniacum]